MNFSQIHVVMKIIKPSNQIKSFKDFKIYLKVQEWSNRALFPCLHSLNSPNPSRVKMRLCKHGKSALLLLKNNSLKNTRKSETSHPCLHTLILTHLSTNESGRSGSAIL